MAKQARRPPGRPPDADGPATRAGLMAAARAAFAELGYMGTTYRELQQRSGFTTATLYHYFPSKLDLYAAVQADVVATMYDRWLVPATHGPTTLVDHVEAFLDSAQRMHAADPSLTLFVLGNRIDARRHPEVAALRSDGDRRRYELFGVIADAGIASGELAPSDREVFIDTFDAVAAGLVMETASPRRYANALDGIRRLTRTELVRRPR